MIRQGARFADDVAGKSVRELTVELEELSAKAGDTTVEQLIKRGGPGALKLVRGMGNRAPEAVRLIARHGEVGKLAIEQGGTAAIDVFREFGDQGVQVLAQQGASTGGRMLAVYGKTLADSADRLAPENLARLRHWTPEVEKAPAEWRHVFCEKLKQGGDDFVVWVHKRWKEVAVTGGLTIAGISAYKVGDGIAGALPNPIRDPYGWVVWWTPVFIVVAILAAAWVARHVFAGWIKAKRSR
jgi:hypothetical protein